MSELTREEELGELRAALWPGDDWRLTWGAEFAAGLAKALPHDARVSGMLGGFLTDLGRYEEALAVDERTVELDPSDAVAWYNLACSQALLGKADAAFASLELAAERGFADAEAMDTDSDLDSIRGVPRFAKLARAVRANADGRGEE